MKNLIYHERLDSTNRLAKELVGKGLAAGAVIQAGSQDAGRGQYERSFSSPPGGLYFSLILHPLLSVQEISLVTLAAGLGCRDAIIEQCDCATLIKWPNDLYCSGKKIAGILSEHCSGVEVEHADSIVVVGVGINVNNRFSDFPEELRGKLSTLQDCCGRLFDTSELLKACVNGISRRVTQLTSSRSTFFEDWRQVDYLYGRMVQHSLREMELGVGIGKGIDEQGCYLLEDKKGQILRVLGGQLRPMDSGIEMDKEVK